MKRGYYVTAIRGRRVAWLVGPFDTFIEAFYAKPKVRKIAVSVDPFIDFDLFGTAMREGETLPEGKLNSLYATNCY